MILWVEAKAPGHIRCRKKLKHFRASWLFWPPHRGSSFCPDQVFLSKSFHLRPGWNRDAQNAGFSREISALCTACPGIEMLQTLDFLNFFCTLHSVSWNRDAQNAGFFRAISALHSGPWNRDAQNAGFSRECTALCTPCPWLRDAQNAGFSREISAVCTVCPGCEMLKTLDYLGKSLHFAQRAVLSRSVCRSASSKQQDAETKITRISTEDYITQNNSWRGPARSLHHINYCPQKFDAVKFPVIITDNISPKPKKGM